MLKPVNCRTLAFRRFNKKNKTRFTPRQHRRFSSYDPLLTIDGQLIRYIGDDDLPLFKYVGVKIQYDIGVNLVSKHINDNINDYINKI